MDKPNTATIADIIVIIAVTLLNPMLFPQTPPPCIPDKVVKYYKPQLTADSIQHAIALTEKEIDEMSYYLRLHNVMDDGYNLVAEYNTTLQQRLNRLKAKSQHPSPNTQHPSPITQHPTPITQHPTPITHHPSPITHHPTPNTHHHPRQEPPHDRRQDRTRLLEGRPLLYRTVER